MNKNRIFFLHFIWLFFNPFVSDLMAENNYDLTSLKACPDKPNCVSTVEKHLPALKIQGDLAFVHSAIEKALKTFSNYKIVKQTNNYFHIEFTSSFFQFTDDLELLIVEREGLIHCRSASRIGWSDLGVNKNRVKKLFAAIQAQSPR